eukprot:TRINITY_DN22952_c0_g1_i1.p1 TRINITY_DN22952_c0_g1~~TRINITY_DN22952_c0_g1_i1.p1  ORF type:complete len:300 (-),score=60.79 TRINITY_DN22952_c0_g1_i1:515-1414(-)
MFADPIMSSDNLNTGGVAIGLTVRADEDIYADPDAKTVRAKQGNTVLFRINTATKLKKLKRAFCQKVGVAPEAVDFTFGGMTITDTHSAGDLYMIDNDVIIVKHAPAYLSKVSKVPSSRLQDFTSLLHKQEFADVTLVVGKEKVKMPAIKAILCARSEKFRAMFSENFAESKMAEVSLPNHAPHLMKLLLQYLYTDVVEVPQEVEDAAGLMVLAEEYILPHLKRECEIALLPQVRERNVCSLLQTADMYSSIVLKEICKQFVLDNFDTKPHLGDELQKSPHLLVEITHAAIVGNKRRRL